MTLPNFLIVGAQRSGTTAVYDYLRQHSQVYTSPIKEPAFFAREESSPGWRWADGSRVDLPFKGTAAYQKLFRGARGEKAIGEASTAYLHNVGAADRIRAQIPEVKLVALLRHPAERAYSGFLYLRRDGAEPIGDFESALRAEQDRRAENWAPDYHYVERGFYHRQLAPYFEKFPSEQIRIYLYEDLKRDPNGLARDLYRFLGVDERFSPDTSSTRNASGIPRNGFVRYVRALAAGPGQIKTAFRALLPPLLRRRVLTGLRGLLGNYGLDPPPPLSAETRALLVEIFTDDIRRLETLIQRDLSHWYRQPSSRWTSMQ